ncbi:MAG TPA: CDP-alcohol phosphatidyltransferase family protein [Candidatus Limnocylindria bacterium]|nr:CDP-alcohol phosphatidyltransferase family protein [Candidatus Limnocylindria bacterium]
MSVQETAVQTDRVLTIPNLLSLLRLLGVPVFLWLVLVPEADGWAVVVLFLSGLSDYFDGMLARRWNQISRVGQLLDPIADRLYVVSALVAFGIREIVPWWLVVLILARDLVLAATLPTLKRLGYTGLPVHFLGKAATANLLAAFPWLLLGTGDSTFAAWAHAFGWAFLIWGTALYWWAGIGYLWQVRSLVVQSRGVPPGTAVSGAAA